MRGFGRGAAVVLWIALASGSAYAQPWAPPEGSGAITLAAQTIDNTGHVLSDGSVIPVGKSRTAAIYLQADYAVTDRFSIAVGIPFVFAKYLGPPPPPGVPEPPMVQPVDRCYCWQRAWQDFGLTARFNLLNGSTAVTSSVSIGVPSHGYEYRGEAVVGRGLRELHFAVDAGQRLDWISPRLSVSSRYAYTLVPRVLGVPSNRSNLAADIAFQVTDAFAIEGNLTRQVTHGGLRTGSLPPGGPDGIPWGEITTPELFREHDRLLRDNYWRMGTSVSYSFRALSAFVSYLEFLSGSDTHRGRALTGGISIPFDRTQP